MSFVSLKDGSTVNGSGISLSAAVVLMLGEV
jgi:hypothetical protein